MSKSLLFVLCSLPVLLLCAFRSAHPYPVKMRVEPNEIHWLTAEEAFKQNKSKPKKFVVDVYTDWCGWCKVMDRETFKDAAVVDFINENYYAVKLNAEQKETITLGTQTFKSLGGIHELAAKLLNSKMSYPTTVFLDERFKLIQSVPGYLEPKIFHQIATYFGGNYFKKEAFDQYKTVTYLQLYGADAKISQK